MLTIIYLFPNLNFLQSLPFYDVGIFVGNNEITSLQQNFFHFCHQFSTGETEPFHPIEIFGTLPGTFNHITSQMLFLVNRGKQVRVHPRQK